MKSYETEPGEKINTVEEAPGDAQYTEAEEEMATVEEPLGNGHYVEEMATVEEPLGNGHYVEEMATVEEPLGNGHHTEEEVPTVEEPVEDMPGPEQEVVLVDIPYTEEELPPASLEGEYSEEGVDGFRAEKLVERARRRGFSLPSREQLLKWAPYWGIILLGAVLRFWALGDKPLHHDESLHAYFSLHFMDGGWLSCFSPNASCYHYDPLLHGPFQFHFIALVYQISQMLGAPDHGVNTTTVRILAATLGTIIVALPYFLRDYLGKWGSLLACFLLAVSPSMVYFSRFAREDIYMACFTLLLVVGVARYLRDRQMRWLIVAAVAFSLSYATKEATFLTVGVFGSFFGAVLAWELGLKWRVGSQVSLEMSSLADKSAVAPINRALRFLRSTAAPYTLLAYLIVIGIAGKIFFGWLEALSVYVTDPKNTPSADLFVQGLKEKTVAVVPWIGIILGIYVLSILGREMFGKLPPPGRRGLAKYVDPQRQRFLDAIVTMPWTHWFFAVLAGWTVFLVLFTVLFTNIKNGIGDGIWQGLYYWIQQQQVARGGQPWYYYLLLIPLYEQIGVVFGLVGIIRCLVRPTRFRLFLVYWFVGNLFIYSWASEKMPWLMVHITMPMLLLAAIGLEPCVVTLVNLAKNWLTRSTSDREFTGEGSSLPIVPVAPQRRSRISVFASSTAILGVVMAVLLLLPTLHNMYEVTYVHPADGPHEMMVYVQTTTDVNIVMAKVDELDQKMYGGKHLLPIGLMNDATWPFAWYVRDYTNVCFNYPDGCSATAKSYPVIIAGGDNLYNAQAQYSKDYDFHQYHMRTWWDEGYKPPPCVPTKTDKCTDEPTWGGVGVGLWLSYGDNPPPHATFNLGLAVQHVWQWWWDRRAIGDTGGTYDMGLFIKKGLGVRP